MTAPGTLFVVATPIGNLEDITLRALRILKEVAVVAAEDTRRTGNLLRHYQIQTPLLSLHEHNEAARIPAVLRHLETGRSVALVSDAGTPGISDPGAVVVRAVREAGYSVIPIPGPSALAAALSVAGIQDTRFCFAGFPPIRSNARKTWLRSLRTVPPVAVIFFEAPHRVRRTLADLVHIFGKQPILVGREVTKVHEEWRVATAADLLEHFQTPQGEFVFVVTAATPTEEPSERPKDSVIYSLFCQLTQFEGLGRREGIRRVAEQLGLSPKIVYAAIERAKVSGY